MKFHRQPISAPPAPGSRPFAGRGRPAAAWAFTLTELLVVIAIMGLIAAIGLPALRGMTKSNAIIATTRQFQDDLAYARQRAIADHTSVYMIFVPPWISLYTPSLPANDPTLVQFTNMIGSQYSSYALLSMRLTGEQPGRATPHYLTPWRSLPNGVFIDQAKFEPNVGGFPPVPPNVLQFSNSLSFPFPNATNYFGIKLPYLGFDYLGRLTYAPGVSGTPPDEYIPLARGSIFYARNPDGTLKGGKADIQEQSVTLGTTNYSSGVLNIIHINALTGRAKLETPAIQ